MEWDMKIRFFVVMILLLLSACTVSAENTPVASPSDVPEILTVFPLAKGARWEYAAEIEYQDTDDAQSSATWTGTITVEVVDQERSPDGQIVFTLEETLVPTPPGEVWRGFRSYQYTVTATEIFDGAQIVLQWPLEDGLSWKTWPDSDFVYQTEVVLHGDVETPYGNLKDCYQIIVRTNPDVQIKMFCPEVGFVGHFYHHFGTPQDEFFELTAFEAGE
jgi:hypothetical protein